MTARARWRGPTAADPGLTPADPGLLFSVPAVWPGVSHGRPVPPDAIQAALIGSDDERHHPSTAR